MFNINKDILKERKRASENMSGLVIYFQNEALEEVRKRRLNLYFR